MELYLKNRGVEYYNSLFSCVEMYINIHIYIYIYIYTKKKRTKNRVNYVCVLRSELRIEMKLGLYCSYALFSKFVLLLSWKTIILGSLTSLQPWKDLKIHADCVFGWIENDWQFWFVQFQWKMRETHACEI